MEYPGGRDVITETLIREKRGIKGTEGDLKEKTEGDLRHYTAGFEEEGRCHSPRNARNPALKAEKGIKAYSSLWPPDGGSVTMLTPESCFGKTHFRLPYFHNC